MTRLAAVSVAVGVAFIIATAGCAPDPVPRTLTVSADSTLGPVLAAVVSDVEQAHPGLAIRLGPPDSAQVVLQIVSGDALDGARTLARASLVLIGPPGAPPAPSLESALAVARTVAVGSESAAEQMVHQMPGLAAGVARFVRVESVQAALDSVAARSADLAFALAPEALSSTAYAVVYRPTDAESPPAVVIGTLGRAAPPEARALLDALAAPTAYRAWAAAGFRPPPR